MNGKEVSIVKDILERYSSIQVNLASESARNQLAVDIVKALSSEREKNLYIQKVTKRL